MGSRLSIFGIIPILLIAFIQAPFAHVHEHESTQRHPGAFFHTHFAHIHVTHASRAEWNALDPDDDAVFQHWFSLTQGAPYTLNVILCAVPMLPPPVVNEWRVETIRPSAHDPPGLTILPPRSPPA